MKIHEEFEGSGIVRQGDVMLVPAHGIPAGYRAVEPDDQNRVVLAEGEVTGHAHALPFGGAVIFRPDASAGPAFVEVKDVVALHHEEHSAHAIPRGAFKIVRQRQYTSAEARRVAD